MSDENEVVAADISSGSLSKLKKTKVKTIKADLNKARNIEKIIKNADLVLVAVPGFMGYKTLETVIKAGKNAVDISFFNEDAFGLDKLAKKHKVTAVARLVLSGKFSQKGICPPEYVGRKDGCLDFVLDYLRQRGVVYQKTVDN